MQNSTSGAAGWNRERSVRIVDHLKGTIRDEIARDLLRGLKAAQKFIPCKYFYDARGTRLFEAICRLPEYYPTRTELSILSAVAPRLIPFLAHRDVIELGSGSDWKVRTLLQAAGQEVRATMRYLPVDISRSSIVRSSLSLLEHFPELEVLGIVADFTAPLETLRTDRPALFCFWGSTIGNFDEPGAVAFLKNISRFLKTDDALLIGFDMLKPVPIIETAYNDSAGITAQFNKNILRVANRELQADFIPSHFEHQAFFNARRNRIEMHLMAKAPITVRIPAFNEKVEMETGQTIHTENSRKFTREDIGRMAGQAGLVVQDWYMDTREWYSLVVMGRQQEDKPFF